MLSSFMLMIGICQHHDLNLVASEHVGPRFKAGFQTGHVAHEAVSCLSVERHARLRSPCRLLPEVKCSEARRDQIASDCLGACNANKASKALVTSNNLSLQCQSFRLDALGLFANFVSCERWNVSIRRSVQKTGP